jgi:hypothetical protein
MFSSRSRLLPLINEAAKAPTSCELNWHLSRQMPSVARMHPRIAPPLLIAFVRRLYLRVRGRMEGYEGGIRKEGRL